jgi:hypothetical protein
MLSAVGFPYAFGQVGIENGEKDGETEFVWNNNECMCAFMRDAPSLTLGRATVDQIRNSARIGTHTWATKGIGKKE